MRTTGLLRVWAVAAFVPMLGLVMPGRVAGHCDTMDGPVVQAAKQALAKGDVTPVLKWVREADEAEVKEAFRKNLGVRVKGEDVRELADLYFFETVVRLHRASEGEPYTGLKPAGSVEPGIAAADKALDAGSVKQLADETALAVRAAILNHFTAVPDRKKNVDKSVAAGREFVKAYVRYIHFMESVHQLVSRQAADEHGQPLPPAPHKD